MSSPASAPTTPPQLVYPRRLRAGQMDRQDPGTEPCSSRLKHCVGISISETCPSPAHPATVPHAAHTYTAQHSSAFTTPKHDLSSPTRRANEPSISNPSTTYTPCDGCAALFPPFPVPGVQDVWAPAWSRDKEGLSITGITEALVLLIFQLIWLALCFFSDSFFGCIGTTHTTTGAFCTHAILCITVGLTNLSFVTS